MTRDEIIRGVEGVADFLDGNPQYMDPRYEQALRAAIALLTPPDPLPDDVRQAMFDAQKLVNEVQKKRISTLEAKLARVRALVDTLDEMEELDEICANVLLDLHAALAAEAAR